MRIPRLLVLAALLLPGQAAWAQSVDSPSADGAPAIRSVVMLPAAQAPAPGEAFAASEAFRPRRNHLAGAALGAGIGALVGGVGFAAMNYAKTESSPRTEYTGLSLMLGGVVGGAAGLVIGGIIGTPGRSDRPQDQMRLRLAPGLPQGRAAASLSVDVSL